MNINYVDKYSPKLKKGVRAREFDYHWRKKSARFERRRHERALIRAANKAAKTKNNKEKDNG